MTVRVRIAPSPTGDPHIGTAYIGLINKVFAQQQGGQFILRIEDTDQSRCTPTSEAMIYDALRWVGIQWDEGPDCGGDYGPYRQSERSELYTQYAQQLVDAGKAYPCFCTPERLANLRAEQMKAKGWLGYDGHCRDLDPAEARARMEAGEPYVIRLRVDREGTTVVRDLLRDPIEFSNKEVDDQVLVKSDGFPTYHLANVVDDHLMKISHVIRGEEWITSTPKHVMLYEAFGWKQPIFCRAAAAVPAKTANKRADSALGSPGARSHARAAPAVRGTRGSPAAAVRAAGRCPPRAAASRAPCRCRPTPSRAARCRPPSLPG